MRNARHVIAALPRLAACTSRVKIAYVKVSHMLSMVSYMILSDWAGKCEFSLDQISLVIDTSQKASGEVSQSDASDREAAALMLSREAVSIHFFIPLKVEL